MSHISNAYDAAENGRYFTAWLAATVNTAVATTTQALASTSPSLVIFNGQPAGGLNIYMKATNFMLTSITSGLTSIEHVGVLNSGSIHTTVGTLMSTPVNPNGDSGASSLTRLYGGVNVMSTPAAESRIVHTGQVDNSIYITLDTWRLVYGEDFTNTNKIGTMSAVKNITVPLPPVIIAPQQFYTLGFWGASWNGAATTYRMSASWIEQ